MDQPTPVDPAPLSPTPPAASTAHRGFATGMAPGVAVYTGPHRDFAVPVQVWEYSPTEVHRPTQVPDATSAGLTLWVDVEGVHDVELVEEVGRRFGLHPLVVESIVAPGQRVRVERHDGQIIYTVRMLVPGAREAEQVTLVQAGDYVLTFQELPGDNFDPIRERITKGLGSVRQKSAAYLAYALLDAVVDGFATVQKNIEDKISALEDELDDARNPDEAIPGRIHTIKRELRVLGQAVRPLRDEIGRLVRDNHPLIPADVVPFFRDLHDHLFQVAEGIDVTRETSRSLMELHVSNVSQKMNEDMRVLTVVATVFIPLTFLAGVYGMNFEYIPELKMKWAYPAFWVVATSMVLVLGLFFRRRRWL